MLAIPVRAYFRAPPTSGRPGDRFYCLVHADCPEFGGCALFWSSKCIESTKITVGTSTVVHYTVDVRYWECPLTEFPLYNHNHIMRKEAVLILYILYKTYIYIINMYIHQVV